MGKVQLNSQDALYEQQKRLHHCIEEYAERQTAWNMQQKDGFYQYMNEFAEAAFTIMKENIEIKGQNWYEACENKDILEKIDVKLEDNLIQRQIRVNELIVEVTKCRNEVPVRAAQVLEQGRASDYSIEIESKEPKIQSDEVNYDDVHSTIKETIPRLSRLSKVLPAMVSNVRQQTNACMKQSETVSNNATTKVDERTALSSASQTDKLLFNVKQRSARSRRI
eukprot:CFRG1122T1